MDSGQAVTDEYTIQLIAATHHPNIENRSLQHAILKIKVTAGTVRYYCDFYLSIALS